MNKINFLVLVAVFLMSFLNHPIYVSTSEIDYNKEDKVLEIAIKIFSDDLEEVLSAKTGEAIEIGTNREHPKATEYITAYLREHFKLEVNGKDVRFEYVNRKLVKDEFFAMWVLIQVPKVNKLKSLVLENNILVDFNDGQQNHIKFRDSGNGSYIRKVTSKGYEEAILK
ncbi:MAG: hypothetical protein ACI976_000692 [Aureispira sp.]|jgi:hypothetical protein